MAASSVVIHTERLVLAPWREDEAAVLLDIRSRPSVAKWLSDPAPWTDLAQAETKIEEWHQRTRDKAPLGMWAIRPAAGTPVGNVGLNRLPDDDEVEIGWFLHPDATGHGYAREAAAAILARAFAAAVPRVWAIMWAENTASAAVAAGIGMDDLGVVEDPWYGTAEEPLSQMFRADLQ